MPDDSKVDKSGRKNAPVPAKQPTAAQEPEKPKGKFLDGRWHFDPAVEAGAGYTPRKRSVHLRVTFPGYPIDPVGSARYDAKTKTITVKIDGVSRSARHPANVGTYPKYVHYDVVNASKIGAKYAIKVKSRAGRILYRSDAPQRATKGKRPARPA